MPAQRSSSIHAGSQPHFSLPSVHPLPFLLPVIFTPARPAVILNPCWRSYSPLPDQGSSSTLLLAVNLNPPLPPLILYPSCWRLYSPLSALRSSSIPAGSQPHLSPSSGHPLRPPAGGHIHPCLSSFHPLPLLLVFIFTPPRPAVILYPSCWRSYSPLPAQRSSSTPTTGGHIHPSILTDQHKSRRSLTVPDFTISLYGSSCNSPRFGLHSLFFSLYIYSFPIFNYFSFVTDCDTYNTKQKNMCFTMVM